MLHVGANLGDTVLSNHLEEPVKYREFIGLRLLAMLVLVPAMFFVALALEGSGWWLIAAVAYPCISLVVIGYVNRDE